jgi:zinc/manganese transport system substrate-binding protein
VVAAENMWGSIASQLGGERANVVSVISNPDADPHGYEPTPADGRAVAQAGLVITNGAGYDPWAQQLVDASPESGRRVLVAADVAGRHDGDNPHVWYSPAIVAKVAAAITDAYKQLDPADAQYFDQRAADFSGAGLARYNALRATIRTRFNGVRVGATESIFIDLAADLGLDLITPPDYMKAVSEGGDPTTDARSTMDAQIGDRKIAALVYNRQNATPDVRALVDRARSVGIAVVSITETLDPANVTFQEWQAGQLDSLSRALAGATGR